MTAPRTAHLEPPVLEALGALRAAYPDARITLIGASALAFHVSMTWRLTSDIDVVLAITLDDLATAEENLIGCKRLPPPRWLSPNGVKVDIIPAPPDALEQRVLIWGDGSKMGLAGVAAAIADRSHFASHELDITVASLPIIVVLKMAAYLDRPGLEPVRLGGWASTGMGSARHSQPHDPTCADERPRAGRRSGRGWHPRIDSLSASIATWPRHGGSVRRAQWPATRA